MPDQKQPVKPQPILLCSCGQMITLAELNNHLKCRKRVKNERSKPGKAA